MGRWSQPQQQSPDQWHDRAVVGHEPSSLSCLKRLVDGRSVDLQQVAERLGIAAGAKRRGEKHLLHLGGQRLDDITQLLPDTCGNVESGARREMAQDFEGELAGVPQPHH